MSLISSSVIKYVQLNITKSVFEPPLDEEKINQTLSVLTVRTIDGGNSIKFNNKYYMPVIINGSDVYLPEGTKIVMVETFDGKLYINALDYLYGVREIQKKLHIQNKLIHQKKLQTLETMANQFLRLIRGNHKTS